MAQPGLQVTHTTGPILSRHERVSRNANPKKPEHHGGKAITTIFIVLGKADWGSNQRLHASETDALPLHY